MQLVRVHLQAVVRVHLDTMEAQTASLQPNTPPKEDRKSSPPPNKNINPREKDDDIVFIFILDGHLQINHFYNTNFWLVKLVCDKTEI